MVAVGLAVTVICSAASLFFSKCNKVELRSRLLQRTCSAYILASLSPSQPVIADEETICLGTLLKVFGFLLLFDVPSLVFFSPFLLCLDLLIIIACRKEPFPLLVMLCSAFIRMSLFLSMIQRFLRDFFLYVRRTSILYHVVAGYLLPPPYYKHRKHSTVQHSAVNPRNKQQSKYAPIRARQQPRQKQTELARASMSSCKCTARCALKTNEEIEICSAC